MTEEQLKQVIALAAILNVKKHISHNFGGGNGIAAWFTFDSDEVAKVFAEQVNHLNIGIEVESSFFEGLVFVNWV